VRLVGGRTPLGIATSTETRMDKVNLTTKLALITEHWRPKVVGELNGQEVKLVKFQGTFVWHHHDHEDELFLGVRGRFRVEFRDREAAVLVFEPAATRNTGNVEHPELTAPSGVRI
jgi:hypothetical protein